MNEETVLQGKTTAGPEPAAKRLKLRLPVFALMFALFMQIAFCGHAQSVFQGTISGTVTDLSGAVVKGASVQVINEDTHFATQATTNEKGAYTASFLTPGNYDVKVEAATFGAQEQTQAVLIAGAIKEVDFKLKPSTNTAEVTVTANGEMLETGSATINATIDSYLIENTPNTGDNVFFLSTRLPGVYSNQVQGSEKQNWTMSSNGQIGGGNGVSNRGLVNYDGIVDLTYQGNPGGAGGSGFSPPPYATQELSVKTAEFDAQYGHTDGLVYDLVLKNGTPQFHGNAMVTEENTVFDANAVQRKALGLGRPTTNYTEEALNITGPLSLPGTRFHAPRTYFMFGFQHVRFNLPQQTSNVLLFTVPTAKERMGDFSELGAGGTIFDPATTVPSGATGTYAAFCSPNCQSGQRESFTQEYGEGPGNTAVCGGDVNCIPQSRWNPVGAALVGATAPKGYSQGIYPLPNIPTTTVSANYLAAHYAFVTYYQGYVARVDHEFTDNTKMHVSFSRSILNQISNDDQGFPDDELGSTYVQTARNEDITVVDFTHVLSKNAVLDLHTGFYYHPVLVNRKGENFNPTNLGMNVSTIPASLQNFPGTTSVADSAGGSYQGLQNGYGQIDHYYFDDNTAMLSKILGRHSLKAGGEFMTMQDDTINNTSQLGTFSASNAFTDNPCASCTGRSTSAGDGIATLLLGYPTANTSTTIYPMPAYHWNYYATFLQDDWRVNERLTLNMGLRYDYESPITERHGWLNAGFSTTAKQPFCLPNTAGTAITSCAPPPTTAPGSTGGYFGGLTFVGNGVKMPFRRELLDRFQPRLGAAFRVTSRDVLRGGWGLTIGPGAQIQQNQGFSASTSYTVSPGSTTAGLTPATCTAAQGGDSSGFCNLTNPYPNGVVSPTGSLLGLSTFLGQNISAYDQKYVSPRTTIWVADWQHQFPSQLLLDVSYHGANTAGLGIGKNINALPACYWATVNVQAQSWTPGSCPNAGIRSALTANVTNPMAGYLPASSSLNNGTTQQQNLYLPYPEFGTITVTNTELNGKRLGSINYNGLYIEATKRLTHGLDMHASFTFAKVMDQLSYTNQQDSAPAYYLDQQPSRLFELDAVYHFPQLHGANALVRQFTNGWVLAMSENWDQATGMGPMSNCGTGTTVCYAWTGANAKAAHQSQSHWFNTCYIPLKSDATVTNGVVTPPTWYPAQNGGPAPTASNPNVSPCNAGESPAWIQLPSYTLAQQNTNTIMGNVIRFPEGVYLNASIGKMFPIHDKISLELRSDFQNIINNSVMIGSFTSPPTSALYGSDQGATENNDPRYFRLKAVLTF